MRRRGRPTANAPPRPVSFAEERAATPWRRYRYSRRLRASAQGMRNATLICRAGNLHFGDGSDAGKRLAAKAKCGDMLQVREAAHFAGGMRRHSQGQVV